MKRCICAPCDITVNCIAELYSSVHTFVYLFKDFKSPLTTYTFSANTCKVDFFFP